ncbi:hypothetical protein F2Q69_00059873 [Brassica cretica]|uniref:Uncharacterized protein n=1 Tax=Brassica cretica TaxID=69181 RepID=A0A8S9RNY1_BRACR|nr:hypothetical protein F2Q69_00059873 [Brassica cretica]
MFLTILTNLIPPRDAAEVVASRDGGAAGEDWQIKKTTKGMDCYDNEGHGRTQRRRWWCDG